MKMPGTLDFGVQRLGRPDASAMRFKASAEQEAALAWGKTLSDIGKSVQKIAENEALADANLTLSERVAMDKKSTAELDAWLANNPTFDPSGAIPLPDRETGRIDPAAQVPVPEAVRKAAERLGLSGQINTYEIAVEASQQHFEMTRKASMDAMREKHMSDKAIANYNQQMDSTWARSASSATQTHVIQRIQHLKARADLLYNEALNNLDEAAMAQITIEAEQNGIWTPDYAVEKYTKIGSTVDRLSAERMYHDAVTQADLDAADDFVDNSRIEPEARSQMYRLSRQQAEFFHTKEMRKQPINYGKMQAQLIEGTLTKSMVAEAARTHQISGAHANTLRNALETPVPITSSAGVLDEFKGKIALLRFADPTGDPDSVRNRAKQLRLDFQTAFTGMTQDGSTVKKTLTGDDFAQLMQDLDDEVNTALGAGGRVDTIAMRHIQQLTGYTDFIAESLGSNHPMANAKADFERALIDYKDANPQGDAMEFVARNQHLFTAEKYEMQYGARLADQFPMYATDDGVGIQDVVTGKASASQLLHRARTDALNGVITWDQYERLRRGLQYKYEAASSGAKKSDNE